MPLAGGRRRYNGKRRAGVDIHPLGPGHGLLMQFGIKERGCSLAPTRFEAFVEGGIKGDSYRRQVDIQSTSFHWFFRCSDRQPGGSPTDGRVPPDAATP